METGINFLACFEIDVALSILKFLDDPADIIRATAVSHSWQLFVIANGVCKKLFLRKVPSFFHVSCVVEEKDGTTKSVDVVSRNPINWETLESEHSIYSSLLRDLVKPVIAPKDCVSFVVGASSTDTAMVQTIINILSPIDRYDWGNSYWSSRGQSDPNMPESILFKLNGDVCIVSEIDIRPFQVFWEPGSPVYSAKSVQFHMGYPKSRTDLEVDIRITPFQFTADDYVWTYTSPEFAMTQESCLQEFKLPEPAVCFGGFLLIELLGRTQRQEADGLFYVCVGHIKVLGRSFPHAFDLKMEMSGNLLLKYRPKALDSVLQNSFVERVLTVQQPEDDILSPLPLEGFWPIFIEFLDDWDEDENE